MCPGPVELRHAEVQDASLAAPPPPPPLVSAIRVAHSFSAETNALTRSLHAIVRSSLFEAAAAA